MEVYYLIKMLSINIKMCYIFFLSTSVFNWVKCSFLLPIFLNSKYIVDSFNKCLLGY